MIFVSVTRLKIRAIRFLPSFILHTLRSQSQLKKAPGFQAGSLLADKSWTFWTMTAWNSQESMRSYMVTGAHKQAMPYLLDWCDEASVVHWTQPEDAFPSWTEADRRMRRDGRASKVRNPSPKHAMLNYDTPRTTTASPIRRAE